MAYKRIQFLVFLLGLSALPTTPGVFAQTRIVPSAPGLPVVPAFAVPAITLPNGLIAMPSPASPALTPLSAPAASAPVPAAAAIPAAAPAAPEAKTQLSGLSAGLASRRNDGGDRETLRSYFSGGPAAPELPVVEEAAHALFRELLPRFYRDIPVHSVQLRASAGVTGGSSAVSEHAQTLHTITLFVADHDRQGNVQASFSPSDSAEVQQKINSLITYAHEYAHILFHTTAARGPELIPGSSRGEYAAALHAMNEGFALLMEKILIQRLRERRRDYGLTTRDVADLGRIARQRASWLASDDNHYSEGFSFWSRFHARWGEEASEALLHRLSRRRLTSVERQDPAYLLALGRPELLAAYLSEGPETPALRALQAFGRAAKGKTLPSAERREAAALVRDVGPRGWREVFKGTLFDPVYWSQPMEPAFALAQLSPRAAIELTARLIRAASDPEAWERIIGHVGTRTGTMPDTRRLTEIVERAASLPWSRTSKRAWNRLVAADAPVREPEIPKDAPRNTLLYFGRRPKEKSAPPSAEMLKARVKIVAAHQNWLRRGLGLPEIDPADFKGFAPHPRDPQVFDGEMGTGVVARPSDGSSATILKNIGNVMIGVGHDSRERGEINHGELNYAYIFDGGRLSRVVPFARYVVESFREPAVSVHRAMGAQESALWKSSDVAGLQKRKGNAAPEDRVLWFELGPASIHFDHGGSHEGIWTVPKETMLEWIDAGVVRMNFMEGVRKPDADRFVVEVVMQEKTWSALSALHPVLRPRDER